jgi:photosystem II stability/assembly factor-like uncharacterized protein
MKSLLTTLLATAVIAPFSLASAEPTNLFAAAAFTKAQKNSSVPTDAGIFIRSESGEWQPWGPKIQAVSSASVDPSDQNIAFLACGNGIARTRDGGQSWRLVTGWEISDALAIAIDPKNGRNVYAATGWGLWKSIDGGDTWTSCNSGLTETFSKTIVLDRENPDRLLVGTAGGLFLSINRAVTWTRIIDVPPTNILRLRRGVSGPETWLAVTEGHGAWLSIDDGESWQQTAPELANANLYGADVDPTNSENLAVSGWGVGVWISSDGGSTWTNRSDGMPSPNVFALAYDPDHRGRLFASTFEEGTVFSDDAGRSWNDGGLYGALVNDLGFVAIQP